MRGAHGARRNSRGSIAVELTVAAPGLVLLLLLVAAAGRVVEIRGSVDGAARDAARAASLARGPGQASAAAQAAARADLGTGSWCGAGSVRATVTGFPAPGPLPAAGADVTASVSCTVNMSPFAVLGFAAHESFTGTAVAPVDPYMCRDGTC